jgi:hypothetical protein
MTSGRSGSQPFRTIQVTGEYTGSQTSSRQSLKNPVDYHLYPTETVAGAVEPVENVIVHLPAGIERPSQSLRDIVGRGQSIPVVVFHRDPPAATGSLISAPLMSDTILYLGQSGCLVVTDSPDDS